MTHLEPGWYDDGSGTNRWWDGSAWTEHTAPAEALLATPAAAVPEAAPAAAPTASSAASPTKSRGKLIAIVAATVVVIAGLVVGGLAIGGVFDSKKQEKPSVTVPAPVEPSFPVAPTLPSTPGISIPPTVSESPEPSFGAEPAEVVRTFYTSRTCDQVRALVTEEAWARLTAEEPCNDVDISTAASSLGTVTVMLDENSGSEASVLVYARDSDGTVGSSRALLKLVDGQWKIDDMLEGSTGSSSYQ